jgi:hypothetical protein
MESGRNKLRKLTSKLFERIGRKTASLKLNENNIKSRSWSYINLAALFISSYM